MDEASPPPETPSLEPALPETRASRISPATAALLGTALGIVGSIVTTTIAAHYTAKERAEDRQEVRAKDRLAAMTTTYSRALKVARTYGDQVFHWKLRHATPPTWDPSLESELIDVGSLLPLMGSKPAVDAFDDLVVRIDLMRSRKATGLAVATDEEAKEFLAASGRFAEEARKDLQSQ
jgi:hypothetical protein